MSKSTTLQANKDVYATVEFHRWIGRSELDADEQYLVRHYLKPGSKTLEAGTGGGRILLALRDMGFTDLHGFDYVPGFIDQARAADPQKRINFEVQDATRLSYADDSFDQIIYLQQMLSCMDGPGAAPTAAREAYRILRPGGIALFSFLCYEVRSQSLVGRLLMTHVGLIRWLSRSTRSPQATPWIRMGDRFNHGALLDRGPYIYWYRIQEAAKMLENAGFALEAVATSHQLRREGEPPAEPRAQLPRSATELTGHPMRGALYCICRKL